MFVLSSIAPSAAFFPLERELSKNPYNMYSCFEISIKYLQEIECINFLLLLTRYVCRLLIYLLKKYRTEAERTVERKKDKKYTSALYYLQTKSLFLGSLCNYRKVAFFHCIKACIKPFVESNQIVYNRTLKMLW